MLWNVYFSLNLSTIIHNTATVSTRAGEILQKPANWLNSWLFPWTSADMKALQQTSRHWTWRSNTTNHLLHCLFYYCIIVLLLVSQKLNTVAPPAQMQTSLLWFLCYVFLRLFRVLNSVANLWTVWYGCTLYIYIHKCIHVWFLATDSLKAARGQYICVDPAFGLFLFGFLWRLC